MEPWTGAQRASVVKAFYKNGDSFVIAQRDFRREFGIHRNCAVPSGHAIRTLVRNFEATGSTLKEKGGSVKTVRTYTREYCGSERGHWKKSTPFCALPLCVTRAVWSQRSTDFTLPPFFFSVEPVASKFRTQVLMAWPDGTTQLRWIPNSLRNSRWAITILSSFFVKRFHRKSTLCSSPRLHCN